MIFDEPLLGVMPTLPTSDVGSLRDMLAAAWLRSASGDVAGADMAFRAVADAAAGLPVGQHRDAITASAVGGQAFCTNVPADWEHAEQLLERIDPDALDAAGLALLASRAAPTPSAADPVATGWRRARSRSAGRPEDMVAVAHVAWSCGHQDLATQLLGEVSALAPTAADVLTAGARLAQRMGDAITDLWERAAIAHCARGAWPDAIGALEKCLSQQPQSIRAHLLLAEALRLSGDRSGSAGHAEIGLRLAEIGKDNDARRTASRVAILARLNQGNVAGAAELVRGDGWLSGTATDGFGAESDALDRVLEARIMAAAGETDDAANALSMVCSGPAPIVVGRLSLAAILLDEGRRDEALDVLTTGADGDHAIDPRAAGRLGIARAAVLEGFDTVVELLRAHLGGMTETQVLTTFSDDLIRFAGRPRDARDILLVLHAIRPDDIGTVRKLVELLIDLQDASAIVALLQPMLEADQLDDALAGSLADAWRVMREPELALAAIDKALRETPNSLLFRAIRGSTLIQLGRYREAITALDDVVSNGFVSPLVLSNLVRAHVLNGDTTAARSTVLTLTAQPVDDVIGVLEQFDRERLLPTDIVDDVVLSHLNDAELDPDARARLLTVYGRLLLLDGRYSDAADALSEARLRSAEDPDLILLLARAVAGTNPARARDLLADEAALSAQSADPERAVLRAQILSELGDHEQALLAIEEGLSASPDNPTLLVQRIGLCLAVDDFTDAQADFDTLDRIKVQGPQIDELRADLLVRTGRSADAVDLLADIVARDPANLSARLAHANSLLSAGDAAAAWTELDDDFPESVLPDVLEMRAQARLALGDTTAAIALFEAALDRDGRLVVSRAKVTEAYWSIGDEESAIRHLRVLQAEVGDWAQVEFARLAFRMGLLAEAEQAARHYVQRNAEDSHGWYLLGLIQRNLEGPRQAVQTLTHAWNLDPDNLDIAHNLGESLLAASDALTAISVLESAIHTAESQTTEIAAIPRFDAGIVLRLADAYDQIGRTDEAVARVRALTNSHRDDPAALVLTGQAMAQLDAADDAWSVVDVLFNQGNVVPGLVLAGFLLNDSGMFEQAAHALRMIPALDEHDTEHLQVLVWTLRHLPDAAREYLDCAVGVRRHFGPNSWLCRRLGEAHLMLGESEDAVVAFNEALALAGSSLIHAGLCEFLLGHFDTAIDRLLRVTVTRRPGSEGFDLALALAAAGRKKFALEELSRAIANNVVGWSATTRRGYLIVARWELHAAAGHLHIDARLVDEMDGRISAALDVPEVAEVAGAVESRWARSMARAHLEVPRSDVPRPVGTAELGVAGSS